MANPTTISTLFAVLFAMFIFDFFFLGLIVANEVDKQQRQTAPVLAENGTAPADIAKLEPATTEANNNSSSIPRVDEGEEEGNANQQGREPTGLGRILVTLTPVGKSHLRSMMPLINRLTSAGHQVHLLHITNEPDVPPLPNNPNVTVIKMPIEVERGGSDLFGVVWTRTMHSPTLALAVHSMSKTSELAIINNSDKLAQVLNAEWDLLLTSELFNPHGYGLSLELHEKSRVPVLSFCSTRLVTSHAYQIALGQNWVIHLSMFAPGPSNPKEGFEPRNYIHRLTNVLEGVGELAAAVYIDKFVLAPKVALFTGKADFSSAQLHAHNEMVLADSIAYLGHPQSEASEVLNIGAHCEPASELPEDYRKFVEDPKSKGTIYVAFGTWVPWDFAPPSLVNAFFDAFDRLPDYRFVFSFNGKNPVGRKLSAHIRLVAWAPQMDVLSHPKTRVFLTHCGLKSIKESLCSKTPMLGMPIFAEQNYNSRIMINFGMGIALNKFHIDAEQLYAGLRELLENAKYAERVGKMQQMFLDRPMAALDAGEFYVRKIIKKGKDRLGRHHFKRAGIDMLAISYFNLDLLSCILLVVFALAKY